MEIGNRLKGHREQLGISQEELAARIFVTRQTISNWETNRTYPDLHSLLLLSEQFGTSMDALVKGDLVKMGEKVEDGWKKMSRLAAIAWGMTGAGLVALAVGLVAPTAQSSVVPALSEGGVLGFTVLLLLWGGGMALMGRVERMKRENDLVTYRDILAYSRGEEPPRRGASFYSRPSAPGRGFENSGRNGGWLRGRLCGVPRCEHSAGAVKPVQLLRT